MTTIDLAVGDSPDECGRFPEAPQISFDRQYESVFVESMDISQNVIVSYDGVVGVASIYCGPDGQGIIYSLGSSRGPGLFFRVEQEGKPSLIRITLRDYLNA